MKRSLLFAALLSFCVQAQFIELRKGAMLSFTNAEPTLIMCSNARRNPNPTRIMEKKNDNVTFLADIYTNNETTPPPFNKEEETQRTLYLFDDENDIQTLVEKYPEAVIHWFYIDDHTNQQS